MTHLQKVTAYLAWKWVSYTSSLNVSPQSAVSGLRGVKFYGKKAVRYENYVRTGKNWTLDKGKTLRSSWQDAQTALVVYLHSTRGLSFTDADLISRNSPQFLQKLLLKVVDNGAESLSRFLRYHPINEFEPFFESIGLEPCEYVPLLPRGFMFLEDDAHLVENYHVLCNYGVPRDQIGRIYKEEREVFGYGNGVLYAKLKSLEGLGLSQCDVIRTVGSHPHLLIGNGYKDYGNFLEEFKSLGFQHSWFDRNLPGNRTYKWRQIHELLCLLSDLGFKREELASFIGSHPDILFDGSGSIAFSLIGLKLKLGSTRKDLHCMFSEFPKVEVSRFASNIKSAFHFLHEMDMDPVDIKRIMISHYAWLGLCSLKRCRTILNYLRGGIKRGGKKRACDMIKENPLVLKNWVRVAKGNRLPSRSKGDEDLSKKHKTKFLLSLGFTENSNKMADALKIFRGKGDELQDRFDCFVKAGLTTDDVSKMVKASPRILEQTTETIQAKIDCLVNEMGYPVSDLVSFPLYVTFNADKARLRHSMYKWLCDQGIADPNLALSTLIKCSDKIFIRVYVNSHPKGPLIWEELRKKIYHRSQSTFSNLSRPSSTLRRRQPSPAPSLWENKNHQRRTMAQ